MAIADLLKSMNDKQKEAVEQTEGPLLVMAGAGSGKTRVLTHRIAYLIEDKHVMPWNILAITFTNKAAREMKERVNKLLEVGGDDVWVSTFHALGVRILRRNIEKLGYNQAFNIAGTSEQKTLIKRILSDQNLDPKKNDPRAILGAISNAKNDMETPAEYAEKHNDGNPFHQVVAGVYEEYQKRLKQNDSVDFDDLIMLTIELFEKFPDVLSYYQNKFHYIHVDEYQDTNEAQYRLVQLLADKYQNICVVGDADQSIYGWRGANMSNILNFEKDYPTAHTVMLEQNYRSTKTILDAANGVIQNNDERKDKNLWTENAQGEKITYYRAQSERDEAQYIVAKIKEEIEKGHYSYDDFAVLYRTNAQSRVIEETFMKSNIPYNLVGGHKFYERKEIMDILSYLGLVANPNDSLSFERVINVPKRGIGNASFEKLRMFAGDAGMNLSEAAANVMMANAIPARARNAIANFGQTMKEIGTDVKTKTVTEITEAILEKTGYLAELKQTKSLENQARIENIEEFISVTQNFDDKYEPADSETGNRLVDFLADLALVSAQDDVDENAKQVTLMTLHAAKGLEFPVVFMPGMEEKLFPLARAAEKPNELEEERRLAYVGITRAQKKLYMTNAFSRMLYGRMQNNPASRFMEEIKPELLANDEAMRSQGPKTPFDNSTYNRRTERAFSTPYKRPTQRVEKPQETGANKKNWTVGDKVTHKAWGIGTVVKVNGTGEDMELDIAFPEKGIKRLLAAFAPITKVEK
ncbi:DNA helicase PcrA [Lactobacillus sanfranciscensis]|uniref:ATP-dependent DNA helicase n=1 Tax=Fructilactobacillus sanfranciscensis (strain TMW 1.1304) TaxID=714313 RepID=G2KVV1_FRUST|nr:DNA helicase PcrA [Fructilactobacillus sanfranciscensis]AEN99480.1 ATP-dependent DNA helicase pcrA [Fructilactobacillus sanfranciscensis TMW 1.1304]NDR75918.1 DNA helicase PcrA [Fructilactobacillus sanfranciscensis]NDR96602.1 DNA helicase PcrA [Fructilactobacillus sanfranciscensis]NDS04379.1 DNA helicase PcrA [Fructilactobacillus sanfranciscensis]POH16798.1 ATP-dependent DNA helicase PcrA [Fructilactobacillus sanfranciscensis]